MPRGAAAAAAPANRRADAILRGIPKW